MEAVFLAMVLMLSIFLGFELISKVPATPVSYTHLRAHET